MSGHKDLYARKKSMQLVLDVYPLTSSFPREEIYGLTSQIRRAAVSIPSNIAEEVARYSRKEFSHFLYVALGSLAKLETQLLIARDLGYIQELDDDSLSEIGR